ncbi:MAG: rhodanese-like domain-containing protein [Sulfurovaceae bacterium]|nr:rhodanese-like domain-containing protein [Sulfurovaceae bacterium]
MKQIFTKKTLTDIAYWLLILSILGYFLYQKGWILTNFSSIEAKEAYSMLEEDDNVTLLDVRTSKEFKEDGFIPNAKLIPLGVLKQNLQMLDKSKKVLIYCRSGNRSITAARILEKQGFMVINLSGGIIDWKSSGFSIKK